MLIFPISRFIILIDKAMRGDDMEYITSAKTAEILGITRRMVNLMCQRGEIPGAKKEGNRWLVPEEFTQKTGNGKSERIPLPIGVSNFAKIVKEYYYIDKTMLIKEIIDNRPQVSLFLRPRRFGKTLNMDMLRTYFEITDEDRTKLFEDKAIWKAGSKYRDYFGKYPVIYFTFKDMKFSSWHEMFINIKTSIQEQYGILFPDIENTGMDENDRIYIRKVISGELEDALWSGTLGKLTELLDKKFAVAPMILIDEYDTPIQQGHFCGFYDEIIGFMRNFMSGGLKDNKHLSMAFLTCILRVAKESIFSGLNNLSVNSVIDKNYSSYFGFTESEVKKLLKDYEASEKFKEIKEWYDGYRFGDSEVYNPWSVLNYVAENCTIKTYWQSTGSNEIIGEIISSGRVELIDEIRALLMGGSKNVYIDNSVVYPEVSKSFSNIYSFLLMGGYLTLNSVDTLFDGNSIGEVRIPNLEVMHVFEKEILNRSGNIVTSEDAACFQRALLAKDNALMQELLQKFLRETISFFDASAEGFYHGLLLGLSATLNRYYDIKSNREAGDGRYDIALIPRHSGECGYIIEVKSIIKLPKSIDEMRLKEMLDKEAADAIAQIDNNHYADVIGKNPVFKIGVAFYKKTCSVVGKQDPYLK